MKRLSFLVMLCGILASPLAGAVDEIKLFALFNGKAILLVDGSRRVLEIGAISPEGVKLVSTDTVAEEAVVEIGGKPKTLKLGMVMTAGYARGTSDSVTLYAGDGGHFFADGFINEKPVHFLVDTGATTIALNSHLADSLGIDYRRHGQPGLSSTASGVVRVYLVTLPKVRVGQITLYSVKAGVIEGAYPTEPLLGMSFLGSLEMKREGNTLELTRR